MTENILKRRKLVPKILKFLPDDEIIVIHGSRQVGKTSLLHYLIDNHIKKITTERNIFYFDLEDFSILDLCNSTPDAVVSYVKTKGADLTKKVYLLIDEIQYLQNPSSFLKLFYDKHKNKIKLIVSGSSSMLIKKKFKVSLVGRTVDFELFPLDFEEFLDFKGLIYDLSDEFPEAIHKEIKPLYTEYIIFGGYPAIVLEEDVEKKETKLKQIISTYIKKDIRDIADIRDIDKFNNLIQILASQIGELVNILELSNTLKIAKQTITEYLFLLENTYIIKRIRPFHKNLRSELTKMPKIFFEDSGLANLLANKTFSQNVTGPLLENSVYSQLRKNIPADSIYFWRTVKKQEIDFVIDTAEQGKKKTFAIEVKNIFLNKYTNHLKVFGEKNKKISLYFCCIEKKEASNNSRIKVIYPWKITNIIK